MTEMGVLQNKIDLLRNVNPKISIKINTVVSRYNYSEMMYEFINDIMPTKWKVFKELCFVAESKGCDNESFLKFIENNVQNSECPVFVEDNEDMTDSYLMIDPRGRFYQNTGTNGSYVYSDPILNIGVAKALKQITFNQEKFNSRYVPISEKRNKSA
jgi:radical S-adenosyl methionine domain-containing protein 2